ncbi:MAG: 4Fe-4S binding protein [Bacteroidia bacterium]
MAIRITEACINCGNCETKCPNKAIYEGGINWSFSYGTSESKFVRSNGMVVKSCDAQEPLSDEVYYIVPDKCTECVGFHDEPQCISVCPVDCCIPDDNHKESHEELQTKKQRIQIM